MTAAHDLWRRSSVPIDAGPIAIDDRRAGIDLGGIPMPEGQTFTLGRSSSPEPFSPPLGFGTKDNAVMAGSAVILHRGTEGAFSTPSQPDGRKDLARRDAPRRGVGHRVSSRCGAVAYCEQGEEVARISQQRRGRCLGDSS